jgi:hypothetical protein
MTDFETWYAQQNPDLDPALDDSFDEIRSAFNAGAVSQASAWRDILSRHSWIYSNLGAGMRNRNKSPVMF